jgi:hypothetical protein
MLNQFSEIEAPHPPHILDRFYPLLKFYGDLENCDNMFRLVDDVCRLIELNPVPWNNGILFDRDEILNKCNNNSLIEIFRVIYEYKASRENADFWVCKSMVNVNFADELEKMKIKPMYIHLIRDGRDVACSYKNAIVGEKHVYHISRFWGEQQASCLKLKENLENHRYIQVKYESLITNPQKEMHRIAKFLKIQYTPEVLNYYHSKESKKVAMAGKMWSNLAKPVISENYNKYKRELSRKEIILFEHMAGDTLTKLGYKLDYNNERNGIKLSPSDIKSFNSENEKFKKMVLNTASITDLKRRQGQKKLIEEIKARSLVAVF